MKRLVFLYLWLCAFYLRAAVPTFESFSDQFQTNNLRVFYRAVHTNDAGIIYPALANSLTLVTNENVYGTFSLPAKVTLLTLGTNYLDLSTNSTWLLNSPTNDATQVILSLSAGAYQGQLAFITSQNGGNSFILPDLSEQWDVPGAYVDIQGDWVGTTNRGIILQYTAPDWIEMARFDPSGGGGGTIFGTGTPNYIPFWRTPTTLGDSPLQKGSLDMTVNLVAYESSPTDFSRLAFFISTNFGLSIIKPEYSGIGTNVPTDLRVYFDSFNSVIDFVGTGDPEGVILAGVGSVYRRRDGGAATSLYVKESGTGNTGWVAVGTGGGGTTINPTDGVMPYRINATTFGDSPFVRTTDYSVSLVATNLATNPNFIIESLGTNALSAIVSGYLSDSDGTVEMAQINLTKAGANWGVGTPTLRDGSFNVSVLHDAAMNQRFGIDGDTGQVNFFDRDGNVTATIDNNGTLHAKTFASTTSGEAPTAITFPASTANWTNTTGVNIELYIDNVGITGTAIKKNGTQILGGLITGYTLLLRPGDYFSETYSIGTPSAAYNDF